VYQNVIRVHVYRIILIRHENLQQSSKRNFVLCNTLVSGNACCRPGQNLLSSRFLSKNMKVNKYRTIILPVVLCGCETWSLTLKEESRLRMFENVVLGRIFGPKSDEVTGEWRKLDNEEFNDMYFSPDIFRVIESRRMRCAGT